MIIYNKNHLHYHAYDIIVLLKLFLKKKTYSIWLLLFSVCELRCTSGYLKKRLYLLG